MKVLVEDLSNTDHFYSSKTVFKKAGVFYLGKFTRKKPTLKLQFFRFVETTDLFTVETTDFTAVSAVKILCFRQYLWCIFNKLNCSFYSILL